MNQPLTPGKKRDKPRDRFLRPAVADSQDRPSSALGTSATAPPSPQMETLSMAAKRVLFVCMGNICCSPIAESVLQKLVEDKGLESDIVVDSAGTDAYHVGEPADQRMSQAASRRGYTLSSIARQVQRQDFDDYDLILAMDRSILRRLQGLAGSLPRHLVLLSTYLEAEAPIDLPDPYYGDEGSFERVLDLIEAACPAILEDLMARDP